MQVSMQTSETCISIKWTLGSKAVAVLAIASLLRPGPVRLDLAPPQIQDDPAI